MVGFNPIKAWGWVTQFCSSYFIRFGRNKTACRISAVVDYGRREYLPIHILDLPPHISDLPPNISVFHKINGFLSLQLKLMLQLGLRLRLTNIVVASSSGIKVLFNT